jgi:hypothetical protein
VTKRLGLFYVFAALCMLGSSSATADDSCDVTGNLTFNCNFDWFVENMEGGSLRVVPEGWNPWATTGDPAFDVDDHGSAPGAPAQRIWSDGGSWTAGLYQQVPTSPGSAYTARIDWAAISAPDIERKVGIDPLGGTDPLSPSVVWGPSEWTDEKMPDLRVTAFAQAPSVTVFVWTHHPVSHGQDQVFLDAVTLVEDPTQIMPTLTPSAVPTDPPPSRTPSPVPASETATEPPASPSPTGTPTAAATFLASETPTPVPTEPPTPTSAATLTPEAPPIPPTETPTPSPTPIPSLTAVPIAAVASTPEPRSASRQRQTTSSAIELEDVLLLVSVVSLVVAVPLAGAVLWLGIRRRKPRDA